MMSSFNLIAIFGIALVVALAATPLARRFAPRVGWVDKPSARKIHVDPMPLLGGVAIYLACAIALLVFAGQKYIEQSIGIIIGGTILMLVGVWDDKSALPPKLKLLGEFAAASCLLVTDIRIELASRFIADPSIAWIVNSALTLVWVVYVTNAINYSDNMDGLSGGISAIAACFFLLLSVHEGQILVASLSAAVLGACIGFLRYNFNKASIFMGDTGTLFLGFVLAAIGIKLRFNNDMIVTWMIPIFVLGLPLFDITLVTLSRPLRRISPVQAGKDHVSHRLEALGWTRREAVLALYVVSFVLGVLAMLLAESTIAVGYTIGGLVLLGAISAFIYLERIPYTGSRYPKLESRPSSLDKSEATPPTLERTGKA